MQYVVLPTLHLLVDVSSPCWKMIVPYVPR